MTALHQGAQISVVDGCLRIIPASGNRPGLLAIFPYGYTIEPVEDGFAILDERGRRWGLTDVPQDVGGGGAATVNADLLTPVAHCEGPYWIVSP